MRQLHIVQFSYTVEVFSLNSPVAEATSILAAEIWLATGRRVDLATKARAAAAEAV